jgi:hypothetical protein
MELNFGGIARDGVDREEKVGASISTGYRKYSFAVRKEASKRN